MNYIFDTMKQYKTGLCLFYPILYSLVVGLETKQSFEFGAGWSTRIILDALKEADGRHFSISTDSQRDVMLKNETFEGALDDVVWIYSDYVQYWTHIQGETPEILKSLPNIGPFDFVLHDGSHTEEVVYQDLVYILPKMKYNSILCVHDVLHSSCGKAMRKALSEAIMDYKHEMITLPYGFGLSLIKIKDNEQNGVVEIKRNKPTSKHTTDIIKG